MWKPPGFVLLSVILLVCVGLGLTVCANFSTLFLAIAQIPRQQWWHWPQIIGVGTMLSLFVAYVFYCQGWRKWNSYVARLLGKCCLKCGYDLRAHKPGDRCPECGEVYGSQESR